MRSERATAGSGNRDLERDQDRQPSRSGDGGSTNIPPPTSPFSSFSPRFYAGTLRLLRHPVTRRLAQAVLVAFLLMVFAFLLVRLIPGDPAMILLGDVATEEDLIAYRKLLGIDGPLHSQFGRYISNVARGDFGLSIRSREPVLSIIGKRLPVSLWLTATTIFMTVVLALPLGVAAALYRRSWFGHVFQIVASVFVATPVFFSGLLLILLFAVQVSLAPIAGYYPGFPANLYSLWLPALTINCVARSGPGAHSSIFDCRDQLRGVR